MVELFQMVWTWLEEGINRGRIDTVVALLIAVLTFLGLLINLVGKFRKNSPVSLSPIPPPPGGEVRMLIEDFQAALERRGQEVEERLAQAHGEERVGLENELHEVKRQLSDVREAYAERQAKIGELEAELTRLSHEIGGDRITEIRATMEAGDFSKADALLAEIEDRAGAVVMRAAEAAFQRGKIAALQIRWGEAATHFDKAARLYPTYDYIILAGHFAERTARYKIARYHFERLLQLSRQKHGESSLQTAEALNSLAVIFRIIGQYHNAEPLFRQVMEIRRELLGEKHPDYVAGLNSLANLLRNTGKYDQAESLYQQALKIGKEVFGERHPNYAHLLNGLANLLHDTKRDGEAEPLYRQALHIDQQTLGVKHPDHAIRLNNLANLLRNNRRFGEAEPLYRQALEIDREVFGEEHPGVAAEFNNLAGLLQVTGRYGEAELLFRQGLDIFRTTLGDVHPNTKKAAGNYAYLLRAQFPENPTLSELEAVFGEEVGRN